MKLGAPDRDPVVAEFAALGSDGRQYRVKQHRVAAAPGTRDPMTGRAPRMGTAYWCECNGIELDEEPPGTFTSDDLPGLTLRRLPPGG